MSLIKALSITALLSATSIATPAQANVPCPGDGTESLCLAQTYRRSRSYDRRYGGYDYYYNEINQIYREVLGREVDPNGLQTYSRRLERGDSLREIREDIAESSEAKDRIARIYRELLGRNPSGRTVRDYSRRLKDGWTLSDVRADLVGSDNFQDRYRGRRAPIIQPPIVPPSVPGRPPIYQRPSSPAPFPNRPPIYQPPNAPPPPPPGRPF
ncbi:MAG TPA: DUF4214 domain-containing protein [Coleofasciculaceae cyanobacterium]